MMLACGNMSSMMVPVFGMVGVGGLFMGTITSAFFAALAEDKRAFVAMPLFSVLWCFGIVGMLS